VLTPLAEAAREFCRAVEHHDAAGATDVALDLLEQGVPVEEIVEQVLAPAQVRVGELWQSGQWSVADEHEATIVTEAAVTAVAVMTARRRLSGGPRVLLACAEGEWHVLPARMAAAIAADLGAHVSLLVPSLPADQLRRRLVAGGVDVVALSCSVPTNLLGTARCAQVAREAGVPVVVGGRAFAGSAERARAVGADALGGARDLLDPPAADGRSVVVPLEALALDRPSDALVDAAVDRLLDLVPEMADQDGYARARTCEHLVEVARYTAAAVVADDPGLLDDYLGWSRRTLRGRIPSDIVLAQAAAVGAAAEVDAPGGAALLRAAVERAHRQPLPAG
jgi:MerR family transcriptional regulator, light-induced transcriptional regulator